MYRSPIEVNLYVNSEHIIDFVAIQKACNFMAAIEQGESSLGFEIDFLASPVGAGASKLGRFSPFSLKMKMFPSTNFYDKTIKITAINFSIDYG